MGVCVRERERGIDRKRERKRTKEGGRKSERERKRETENRVRQIRKSKMLTIIIK